MMRELFKNSKGVPISLYDIVVDDDYREYMINDYDECRRTCRLVRVGDCKPFTVGEETVQEMLVLKVQ